MAIGSGALLPGVAENPTFSILSALAYTTGLGYRPTCDNNYNNSNNHIVCNYNYNSNHNNVIISSTNTTINIFLLLSFKADTHFASPTGENLNQRRHCSECMQSVAKAHVVSECFMFSSCVCVFFCIG